MRTHRSKLWKQSQITSNFVSTQHMFSNEKRFKLHSIYWPQKQSIANAKIIKHKSDAQQIARRLSKIIDQQEKNQQRYNKSQRSSLNKIKTQAHKISKPTMSLRQTSTTFMSRQNQQIVKRLSFYSKISQSTLRDKYGFRSPMLQQDPQLEQLRLGSARDRQLQGSSKGFRSARRVDLNLPENFYPGPGFYEIKRYLDGKGKKLPKSKLNIQEKQQ